MTLPNVDYAASTALVTGATSGIGKAIAFEFVTRGIGRLVVHGRNEEKIKKTIAELEAHQKSSKTGTQTELRTVCSDLKEEDGVAKVQKQLEEQGLQVDILVNNAGLAAKTTFVEEPRAVETVNVMCRAVVDLSQRLLPSMIKRDSGGLLTLGSTAAYQPVPWTATYAASKAFVHSWSQAVRQEQISAGSKVRIALIVPGITKTMLDGQGLGERRGTLDIVGRHETSDVAKAALDAYEQNSAASIIGTGNKLLRLVEVAAPASFNAALVAKSRGPPGSDNGV